MINYEKYESICTKLRDCLALYEQMNTKRFTLSYMLSSNESFYFKINEWHLPHLLGVNTDIIKASRLSIRLDSMNNFELLNFLLGDSYRFSRYLINNKMDLNCVFSDKIEEKIKSFETNIRFSLMPMVGIIKIDKSKSWHEDLPDFMDVDYLIIKDLNDSYAVMGLRKNENANYCDPISNMCWNKNEMDKYLKYLKNQECSLPYRLYIKELGQKIWLNFSQKKEKLNLLREWKEKYDITIDVSFDYEKLLTILYNSVLEEAEMENIIEKMNNEEFPVSTYSDKFLTNKLVAAINDYLCRRNGFGDETYSQMQEELKNNKDVLEKQKKELEMLRMKNNEQAEEISKLKREKMLYENFANLVKAGIGDLDEEQKKLTRQIK